VQYGRRYDSDEDSLISLSSADEYLKKKNLKTKGELDISDLPPIEDLKISLNEEKCKPMGSIKSIVDSLGKYYFKNLNFYFKEIYLCLLVD